MSQLIPCENCGADYPPVACRWRCPSCGAKASASEPQGEPQPVSGFNLKGEYVTEVFE